MCAITFKLKFTYFQTMKQKNCPMSPTSVENQHLQVWNLKIERFLRVLFSVFLFLFNRLLFTIKAAEIVDMWNHLQQYTLTLTVVGWTLCRIGPIELPPYASMGSAETLCLGICDHTLAQISKRLLKLYLNKRWESTAIYIIMCFYNM